MALVVTMRLVVLTASLSLDSVGICAQPQQSAQAQSVYRKVPKAYRGTWTLRSPKYDRGKKLVVHARFVKSYVFRFKGKQLGVHVGKHNRYVTVFQIHKGKQVGENYNLKRSHYKHHKALKVSYDTQVEYFTK